MEFKWFVILLVFLIVWFNKEPLIDRFVPPKQCECSKDGGQ